MRRRDFIKVIGGTAAAWPVAVRAEQAAKVARIGFMVTGSLQSPEQRVMTNSFLQGLRERGYVEGHGTTRKRLAARMDSANWGEADSNAAAR